MLWQTGGVTSLPTWYAARYCEENTWRLLRDLPPDQLTPHAVFISNPQRCCGVWAQRSAPSADDPVWWDYHVVALAFRQGWQVFDLDTRLPCPSPAAAYLDGAFPSDRRPPARFRPRFRVVPGADYLREFASDRSHMRRPDGTVDAQEPPEPPIRTATSTMNLWRFVDVTEPFLGEVMDLSGLRRWPARTPPRR